VIIFRERAISRHEGGRFHVVVGLARPLHCNPPVMPAIRTNFGLCLLAVMTAALGSCARAPREHLTLAGSTSLQPVTERWADAYRARRPDVFVSVQGGGSTAGVRAALEGAAQIGLSSRALTPVESSRLSVVAVARDGIVLVVHPENPVRDLTLRDLRAIYAGNVRDWSSLRGRAARITAITREEGSGTRAAFEQLVMAGQTIANSTLVQDSAGAVRQMVGSDPAAIGYISIGLVDATVKALRLDGVTANEASIDAGDYPLVRPFLFVLPRAREAKAADFLAWVTGPEGHALLRQEGLLPPSAEGPHASR
jgi:phosphate transport system substrate-binding protein